MSSSSARRRSLKPATRRAFLALIAGGAASALLWRRVFEAAPGIRRFPRLAMPKPTPRQRAWRDLELGLFIHFGMATFTGREHDVAPPDTFQPSALDTDQWIEAACAMGARYAVLVAKHSDGFLMWQSDAYPYSLRQCRWRDGRGDLVAAFIASCEKYGVKPGIYASTFLNAYWDVQDPGIVRGGEKERQQAYNAATETMLRELWTRYGDLAEIWFDSTVLPPERGGPDVVPLIERHQPHAMVMKSRAATIRISGGETGMVEYPCWSTARRPEAHGGGHPAGTLWLPCECNTPLRDHEWFWNPGQEHKLHALDELVRMYGASVGRNANLLINANPDRRGLIPDADMERCARFGKEIRRRYGRTAASLRGVGGAVELSLPKEMLVNGVVLQEDTSRGERIREYVVEGWTHADVWQPLCKGRSVGHKRIQEFPPVRVGGLRLRCTRTVGRPSMRAFACYDAERS